MKHVTLTGKTKNRGKVIKEFQEDNSQDFVGSLLAGGVGIDLTAASVVIHYDRWWNASKKIRPLTEYTGLDRIKTYRCSS